MRSHSRIHTHFLIRKSLIGRHPESLRLTQEEKARRLGAVGKVTIGTLQMLFPHANRTTTTCIVTGLEIILNSLTQETTVGGNVALATSAMLLLAESGLSVTTILHPRPFTTLTIGCLPRHVKRTKYLVVGSGLVAELNRASVRVRNGRETNRETVEGRYGGATHGSHHGRTIDVPIIGSDETRRTITHSAAEMTVHGSPPLRGSRRPRESAIKVNGPTTAVAISIKIETVRVAGRVDKITHSNLSSSNKSEIGGTMMGS